MVKKTYVKSRKVWKVRFELPESEWPVGVTMRSVHLAGDFNQWSKTKAEMTLRKKIYGLTLELPPGEYQYRYVVNGTDWYNEWHADGYAPNEAGSDNCVLHLPKPA